MAQALPQPLSAITARFNQLSNPRKVAVMVAVAAAVAVFAGLFLWLQKPADKVLFANLADKDSGAVIASLQQMNIPYTVDAGNVIRVPENVVYDARLKLATQGLPKGGGTGFELLDNQRLGISQFAEQVQYQRAIEGELARSIESIEAVDTARVHLAFPKSSVFLRDQQKPSASVLLNIKGGRTLDATQISGIVHLVASSVPELSYKNVTVVDQRGNLISAEGGVDQNKGLDPKQLEYVHAVESSYAKRIENILLPLWGVENVRAQVTASLDFAQTEQTSETFKPNPTSDTAAVRSRQSSETRDDTGTTATGVPGSLSNQPPGSATAPLTATTPPAGTVPATGTVTPARHVESTTNYELDRLVSHTTLPVGIVKRLSVAILVNYKPKEVAGKMSLVPLSKLELSQVENLVRESMGFNAERGDTINVVNAQFAGSEIAVAALPAGVGAQATQRFKDMSLSDWISVGSYALVGLIGLWLFFGVVRPIVRDLTSLAKRQEPGMASDNGRAEPMNQDPDAPPAVTAFQIQQQSAEEAARMASYTENLMTAKEFAKNDPRVVATVIREWMQKENVENAKNG